MIDRKFEVRNFIILLIKKCLKNLFGIKYMEVLISSRNQREFLCIINCKCLYIRNQFYVMLIYMSYMRLVILIYYFVSFKVQRKCIKIG